MLSWFDFLRPVELNTLAVTLRLVIAIICGGFIGLERERKRRPAGFRTHILICLGAAMTTLTSQYIALNLHLNTDMARLGAQVIAGVGFIGAGTIIVTKRRQVKGLTTAAGLWASAIVGLCCGAGFVEGAILATLIILIVEFVLVKVEYTLMSHTSTFNLYVEYTKSGNLGTIVDELKKNNAYINDIELVKSSADSPNSCAVFSLKLPRKRSQEAMMTIIAKLDGVVSVEEL